MRDATYELIIAGGRKIHREQQHQADQRIVCPGCKTIFTRAGNYLAHFEGNQCPCISRLRFLDYVQEKHVHGQILEIKNVLESNQETYESAGLIGAGHEDTEEGGINLIDDGEDADQSAGESGRMLDLIFTSVPCGV